MSGENHYQFYDLKQLNLKITDEFKIRKKITDDGVKVKKKEKETANILKEVGVKNGKENDGECCESCYII